MPNRSLPQVPYEAVSVNARGIEWHVPLWDAIHRYRTATTTPAREAAVVEVTRAVEYAMALAIQTSSDARYSAAIDALRELTAAVKGECPSLLNEDSGGDAELACRIEDVLRDAEVAALSSASPSEEVPNGE